MPLIVYTDLIALFQRMYKERWKYEWGHDETGCVDCSGAFVWAYRQFHATIAHGSNSIARKHCLSMGPINTAKPGWAAFKLLKPDEEGYDLPSKFKDHPDQNDYYHIGLVDLDGKHVLNAQSKKKGFTRTRLSDWGAVAPLKYVQYPESNTKERDTQMETMIVTADSGSTVRVRKAPSTHAAVIGELALGMVVQAEAEQEGWRRITYGKGQTGYMMSKFLAPQSESQPPAVAAQPITTPTDLQAPIAQPNPFVTVTMTQADMDRLYQARDYAAKVSELLNQVLGVG